jgi:glucokinase
MAKDVRRGSRRSRSAEVPVSRQAVGLDVGGTKIAALRVDEDGAVLARTSVPTPTGEGEEIVSAALAAARSVVSSDVVAVGAGLAGMVDQCSGVLRYAPNLPWREMPVAERIGRGTGLPCVADNDANVAAWGEFRFGAGRGMDSLLMLTIGTGIGAGVVAEGKLFRGAHGLAGEVGHIIVEPGGPVCGCGNRGCWEQVASGQAIGRLGREAVEESPASLIARVVDGDEERVDGRLVTRAAHDGDEVAREILAGVGRRLGEGIAGLVNAFDPEIVVVGGGAVDAGELLLGPARAALRRCVDAPEYRPEVPLVAAALGVDAGSIGAAILALHASENPAL